MLSVCLMGVLGQGRQTRLRATSTTETLCLVFDKLGQKYRKTADNKYKLYLGLAFFDSFSKRVARSRRLFDV